MLLTRDAPADLVQVPDRVKSLSPLGSGVGVIVVGDPSYSREELAGFFKCRDVWVVPDGPDAIGVSQQVWSPARCARRTPLWRAAVDVAAQVSTSLALAASGGDDGR